MILRSILALFVFAPLLLATPARAEESFSSRPFVAAHAGYSFPFGTFTGEDNPLWLYNVYSGMFPLGLEAGYRFSPLWGGGVHAQYAIAQLRDACPPAVDCSGGDLRVGADIYFHPPINRYAAPWTSLGVGYERTWYPASVDGAGATLTYAGWDVSLAGGANYHIAGPVVGGPFLALTMGQYSHLTVDLGGNTGDEDLRYRSLHFWFQVGLRLSLELAPDSAR